MPTCFENGLFVQIFCGCFLGAVSPTCVDGGKAVLYFVAFLLFFYHRKNICSKLVRSYLLSMNPMT